MSIGGFNEWMLSETGNDNAWTEHEKGFEAGYQQACEDFGRTSAAITAMTLREFVQWVATQRAYNGSVRRHAQSLYNECVNAVLPAWAEEFIAERTFPPAQDGEGVGTGAGEGAPRQDTGSAWVTRSEDCPEAPAQAHSRATSPAPEHQDGTP